MPSTKKTLHNLKKVFYLQNPQLSKITIEVEITDNIWESRRSWDTLKPHPNYKEISICGDVKLQGYRSSWQNNNEIKQLIYDHPELFTTDDKITLKKILSIWENNHMSITCITKNQLRFLKDHNCKELYWTEDNAKLMKELNPSLYMEGNVSFGSEWFIKEPSAKTIEQLIRLMTN